MFPIYITCKLNQLNIGLMRRFSTDDDDVYLSKNLDISLSSLPYRISKYLLSSITHPLTTVYPSEPTTVFTNGQIESQAIVKT